MGFVPENHIVGKALFVWMSWDKNAKGIKKLDGIDCLQVLNKILLPSSYFGPIEYYAFLCKYRNIYIEVQEISLNKQLEIDVISCLQMANLD